MEGITIDEMSKLLKLPSKTVAIRIYRAGIKPLTRQAVYSRDTLEQISDVKMGRPKKATDPDEVKEKKENEKKL